MSQKNNGISSRTIIAIVVIAALVILIVVYMMNGSPGRNYDRRIEVYEESEPYPVIVPERHRHWWW